MFEFAEEALDHMALTIKTRIDRALNFTVPLGRDVGLAAALANQFDDGLGVAAAIGNERTGWRQSLKQGCHGGLVRCLAGGKRDPQWKAILIHDGVDLGAQSSTKTANGVIRASF